VTIDILLVLRADVLRNLLSGMIVSVVSKPWDGRGLRRGKSGGGERDDEDDEECQSRATDHLGPPEDALIIGR
jgi:hypothetical protein